MNHRAWRQKNIRFISYGFTLIEILVSLAVLSILASLLAAALQRTLAASDTLKKQSDQLEALQFTFLILSHDLEQIVNRPVRSPSGSVQLPVSGSASDLTLSRAGVANPDYVVIQSLFRRAHYYLSGNALWRESWDALDLAPQALSHKRKLLSQVQNCEWTYYDLNLKPGRSWPPALDADLNAKNTQTKAKDQANSNADSNAALLAFNPNSLPVAIRITLDLGSSGKISQLYIVQPSAWQGNIMQGGGKK